MGKLLKLKEWVTLEDAAKHLTDSLGEAVSVADVLRFAIDGRIKPSIYLIRPLPARRCEVIYGYRENLKAGKYVKVKKEHRQNVEYLAYDTNDGDVLVTVPSKSINPSDGKTAGEIKSPICSVEGLYDLFFPYYFLEQKYALAIGIDTEPSNERNVIYLKSLMDEHLQNDKSNYYALEEIEWAGIGSNLHFISPLMFEPATDAKGAIVVVRTCELVRFEESLIESRTLEQSPRFDAAKIQLVDGQRWRINSDIKNAVLRLPSGFISIFGLAVNLKNRESDITIHEALDILGRNVFSRASSFENLENLPRLIDWETKQSVGFGRWAAARLAIATFGIDAIKGKDLNDALHENGFDSAEIAAYLKREANISLDVDDVIESPVKHVSRAVAHEENIITAMKVLGIDPLRLQSLKHGQHGTQKESVRSACVPRCMTKDNFNDAWKRLTSDGRIRRTT